jgi:cytochrome oxidase Cu insertion factor (SCO1/SenC/PrrC family)
VTPGTTPRRQAMWVAAFAVAVALAAGVVAAATAGPSSGRPGAAGAVISPARPVPPIPLVNAAGTRTSLAAFRGRVVVLAPFLSLCAEHCPITTGAFMQAAHAVAAAGLSRKVAFVETTVDPWRDTPRRLRAFRSLIHDRRVTLLTGSEDRLRAFWRFFGVWFKRTPEGSPPAIDWLTHTPERFDVAHTDAVMVIDPRGRWSVVNVGPADPGGHISRRLERLLNGEGLRNLRRPTGAWTVDQLLDDIGHVLGRRIAAAA